MTAKEFLETFGSPTEKIDLETGVGYMVIAPKDFGLLGDLMLSPTKFPRQLVRLLPYDNPYASLSDNRIIKEVIKEVEVEFHDAPNYLVVSAPRNPRGFKFLRICGDFAMWSRTNSAPF